MYRIAMISGAIFAALAVILGAFGAHALKAILDPGQLATFETGVKYQFYHSVALLAAGLAYHILPVKAFKRASVCFIAGIIMFSGSLYLLTFLKLGGDVGLKDLGIITPIGGVFFILGWIFFLTGSLQKK